MLTYRLYSSLVAFTCVGVRILCNRLVSILPTPPSLPRSRLRNSRLMESRNSSYTGRSFFIVSAHHSNRSGGRGRGLGMKDSRRRSRSSGSGSAGTEKNRCSWQTIEHELALANAIAKLADLTDGESHYSFVLEPEEQKEL
ncbi:hypothetical protein OROGR_028003 [Orobanche gracilis]